MNRFVWLTAVAFLVAVPQRAGAQAESEDDERARSHFQAGASHYEAGDYEEALGEFQRAYEISARPELFYNLSLAHQQLGNLDQAVEFLSRYLNETEDIPNRTNLERRLENLRERQTASTATPTATTPPQPTAEPDTTSTTESTATSSLPPPLESAEAGGQPVESQAPSGGGGVPVAAWIGWGIGAAGLVGGAIIGGLALADKSDIEGMPCATTDTCPDSVVSSMETKALVADILIFGVGLGGAAVGTLLFFLLNDDSGESEQAGWSVAPWVGSNQGGASMRGNF